MGDNLQLQVLSLIHGYSIVFGRWRIIVLFVPAAHESQMWTMMRKSCVTQRIHEYHKTLGRVMVRLRRHITSNHLRMTSYSLSNQHELPHDLLQKCVDVCCIVGVTSLIGE